MDGRGVRRHGYWRGRRPQRSEPVKDEIGILETRAVQGGQEGEGALMKADGYVGGSRWLEGGAGGWERRERLEARRR